MEIINNNSANLTGVLIGLKNVFYKSGWGGGALPYEGLTRMCRLTGYGFQDFCCLERGSYFTPFCLKWDIFTWTNVLNSIGILC